MEKPKFTEVQIAQAMARLELANVQRLAQEISLALALTTATENLIKSLHLLNEPHNQELHQIHLETIKIMLAYLTENTPPGDPLLRGIIDGLKFFTIFDQ